MNMQKETEDLLVRSFYHGIRLYNNDCSRPDYQTFDDVERARLIGWDTAKQIETFKQEQIQAMLKTSKKMA